MAETNRQHVTRVKNYWRALYGKAFREYRCHARVSNEEQHPMYRQCARCYGHGREGLYCHQHATKLDNQ